MWTPGMWPMLLADPGDVLLAGAGVDDDEVVVVGELVEDDVVDEGAVGVEHGGVVGLADLQFAAVVHEQALEGGEGAGAAELDVAHVGDVEEADGGADGHVLGDEAGVLDGHVPAAEVDHFGFVAAVGGVEGGFAEGGGEVGHADPSGGSPEGVAAVIKGTPGSRRVAPLQRRNTGILAAFGMTTKEEALRGGRNAW